MQLLTPVLDLFFPRMSRAQRFRQDPRHLESRNGLVRLW